MVSRTEARRAEAHEVEAELGRTRTLSQLGFVLFLLISIVYLGLGQVNNDEGWYLYASKRVLTGALPYRDLAYPQAPLLPYIYALPQVIQAGVLTGRMTSLVFALGTMLMCLVIVRRYGGERAAAIMAVLLSCYTFGIYNLTIVKTYAPVAFCLVATLYFLTCDNKSARYPIALGFALMAVLIRITALAFLLPVLAYTLASAQPRTRMLLLGETVAASLLLISFLAPDWQRASWNLFGSHLGHWGLSPISARLGDILTVRLPDVAQNLGPLLLLFAASFQVAIQMSWEKGWRRDPLPLLVSAVGALLFGASHLLNGLWQVEYLVPAVVALLPLLAIVMDHLLGRAHGAGNFFVQGALVGALFLLLIMEGTQHTDMSGGLLPLAELQQAADFVAQNSKPTDSVVALEDLAVVVSANREPAAGMTLAQFSLQDLPTDDARWLHVVNRAMVLDLLRQRTTAVAVLSEYDMNTLQGGDSSDTYPLQQVLASDYRLALTLPQFGQFSHTLFVFVRR